MGLAGGAPNLLYIGGKPDHKVSNEDLVDELERVIRAEIKQKYYSQNGEVSETPVQEKILTKTKNKSSIFSVTIPAK